MGWRTDGQSQCSRGEEYLREDDKEKQDKAESRGNDERKDNGGDSEDSEDEREETNLTNCDEAGETKTSR